MIQDARVKLPGYVVQLRDDEPRYSRVGQEGFHLSREASRLRLLGEEH